MRDRRQDDESRARFHDLQRRVTVIMLAQLIVLALITASVYYFRGADAARVHDLRIAFASIQASRVEAATRNCEHDNARNRATRAALRRLIAETPRPGENPRVREARVEELVDAIVPSHIDAHGRDLCPTIVRIQTQLPLEGSR